jgi:hypothetical protein
VTEQTVGEAGSETAAMDKVEIELQRRLLKAEEENAKRILDGATEQANKALRWRNEAQTQYNAKVRERLDFLDTHGLTAD